MIEKKKFDFIVVGQGLAGTCITYQLLKQGYTVLVIDKGIENSASTVAAGLYNPIVFKRLTHSWKASLLIHYLEIFYSDLSDFLKVDFHIKLPILKVFSREEEKNIWKEKALDDLFLVNYINEDYMKDCLQPNHGIAKVLGGGAVNLSLLLSTFRNYLSLSQMLLNENFNYQELKIKPELLNYKNIDAKYLVFCEGANAIHNPFFPKKAFKLTHGEIIHIKSEQLPTFEVLNKGVFILPFSKQIYKVGATYRWDNPDGKPSENGRNELISKLNTLLSVPYEIIKHEAGIRPTVVDRRPIIGSHKTFLNVYFLNGLGTKGVMLAPYFSDELVNHIMYQKALDKEVDIRRFDTFV